jgi:hypothetical protein
VPGQDQHPGGAIPIGAGVSLCHVLSVRLDILPRAAVPKMQDS